jgi:hypothetical protein
LKEMPFYMLCSKFHIEILSDFFSLFGFEIQILTFAKGIFIRKELFRLA